MTHLKEINLNRNKTAYLSPGLKKFDPLTGLPKKISKNDITLIMLEECQRFTAKLIVTYGDKYMPIFKRLTVEIEKKKEQDNLKKLAYQLSKEL